MLFCLGSRFERKMVRKSERMITMYQIYAALYFTQLPKRNIAMLFYVCRIRGKKECLCIMKKLKKPWSREHRIKALFNSFNMTSCWPKWRSLSVLCQFVDACKMWQTCYCIYRYRKTYFYTCKPMWYEIYFILICWGLLIHAVNKPI